MGEWDDDYSGNTSSLGPNPYGFNGGPTSALPVQQQQQQGGNPLAGLAQALSQYGGNRGVTAGSMNGYSGGYGDSFGTTTADYSGASMDLPANY